MLHPWDTGGGHGPEDREAACGRRPIGGGDEFVVATGRGLRSGFRCLKTGAERRLVVAKNGWISEGLLLVNGSMVKRM